MQSTTERRTGLEGVVAAESSITYVDGERGELRYRGYGVPELARSRSFEEVAALLWDGELPESAEPMRIDLAAVRSIDARTAAIVAEMGAWSAPLEVLRTAVSAAAIGGTDRERAARLTSLAHATVAAVAAARAGRPAPEFRPDDTAARALLRALTGREPSTREERVFDAILVLHADHELNASTFAARIVAATEADMTGALTAAVAALQGPKHGGANEDVAAMLAALDGPKAARAWAEAKLARYREMTSEARRAPEARFAGFGHRVYRVDDPRAVALRAIAVETGCDLGAAEAVREVVQRGLGLVLNVDYYSAVVYVALGVEPAMFTSIFAASRVAGWCAHVLEQHANNRLIRPRAAYTGPSPRTVQGRR